MSARKSSRNLSKDPQRDRVDHEGLGWAIAQIHEWRRRVDNRVKINDKWLGGQLLRIAEIGVQPSLLGFVILGCEWMFRLRTSRPQDVEVVLGRIERRLLPVLHEDAWLVTETLGPSIRKLFKSQRLLASEWEDTPQDVFVVTEPKAGNRSDDFGYIARLRTRPAPLITARRGPPPKLAPWIAGIIAERLIDKHVGNVNRSAAAIQDFAVDLVSGAMRSRH